MFFIVVFDVFIIFVVVLTLKQIIDYFNNFKFNTLTNKYPIISTRMLYNIQHRKFNVKKIPKFITDFVFNSKKVFKIKVMLQLLRLFEIFC